MGLTSPLPVSLPAECKKAKKIFDGFSDEQGGLDTVIPPEVLRSARGFAIFTVLKAGFLFSGRAGAGLVIARLDNGSWSAPSAIGTAGAGVGGQIGMELTEFIVVLNSKSAVKQFMSAGSLTLGGNMSLAVGPVGRNAEGSGSLNTKGKVAAMYSYSRTKGLFGGVSIEGAVILERSDANHKAYGYEVKAKQILSGQVEPPEWADGIIASVARRAGSSIDENWIDDSPLSSPAINSGRNRGYSFDSPTSTGGSSSPSKSKSSRFSRFSPSMSRSSSNNDFDNGFSRLNLEESRDSDEDAVDDGRGVWAADARKSPSKAWRESSEYPTSGSRSRSNTLKANQHRRTASDNPFADSSEDSRRSDYDRDFDSQPRVSMDTISSYDRDDKRRSGGFEFNGTRVNQQHVNLDKSPPVASNRRMRTPPLPSRPKTSLPTAVALYDFVSSESGDLPFKKNDVIEIVKQIPGEQWWIGRLRDKEGLVPINYLDMI